MFDLFNKLGSSFSKDHEEWDLDKIILTIKGTDPNKTVREFALTIRDFVEGFLILGQPGSGKSSSSQLALIKAGLMNGFGGVFTTVKPTDARDIKEFIKVCGREVDIVEFSEQKGCFDPLKYELEISGKENLTVVIDLLQKLNNLILPEGSGGEDAIFWANSLNRLMNRTLLLLIISKEEVTFLNMKRIIIDAESSEKVESLMDEYIHIPIFKMYKELLFFIQSTEGEEKIKNDAIKKMDNLTSTNYLLHCLWRATISPENNEDYDLIESYFLKEYSSLGEKTKSTIKESFLGIIESFQQGILKKAFTGKIDNTLRPQNTWEKGSLIILNFPTKTLGVTGRLAIGFYRFIFMKALERRITDNSGGHRPVFLVQDEAHEIIDSNYDTKFCSTSRAYRASIITISQNINNFYVSFGKMAEAKTKSFLANLNTKIFHANSDFDTNHFASQVISEDLIEKSSKSINTSLESDNVNKSTSSSTEYQPQVRPIEFSRLRTGGKVDNNYEVEAFVTKAGKSNQWFGFNVFKALFIQKF